MWAWAHAGDEKNIWLFGLAGWKSQTWAATPAGPCLWWGDQPSRKSGVLDKVASLAMYMLADSAQGFIDRSSRRTARSTWITSPPPFMVLLSTHEVWNVVFFLDAVGLISSWSLCASFRRCEECAHGRPSRDTACFPCTCYPHGLFSFTIFFYF